MTDIACWRLEGESFVVRIRGSEYTLDSDEAYDLATAIHSVVEGRADEWLSSGYAELLHSHEARAAHRASGVSLAERLGLEKPKAELVRRV